MRPRLRERLARFDLDSLERSADVVYAVDGDLRLSFVNESYRRVADVAAGGAVLDSYPLGSCVVDGIERTLRPHYTELFEGALESGSPVIADYHCHTPQAERTFRCTIYPLDGEGLLTVHGPLRSRPWPTEELEAHRDPSTSLLPMCAGCRRVRADVGQWRHVPQLLDEIPADTTHGLCEPCLGFYLGGMRTPSGAQR